MWRVALLGVVFSCLAGGAAGQSKLTERTESRPDGSISARFTVDEKGRREGTFESFHPNGKHAVTAHFYAGQLNGDYVEQAADGVKILEATYRAGVLDGRYESYHPNGRSHVSARYHDGQLVDAWSDSDAEGRRVLTANFVEGERDGVAKLTDNGRALVTQKWRKGAIVEMNGGAVYPVAEEALRDELAVILRDPESRPAGTPPSLASQRAAALRRLQAYRYLCRLPYKDMVLDPSFNSLCQAASELLVKIGRLDHTPPDPGGMPAGRYEAGYQGTSHSNLSMGTDLPGSIDGYMDDSDPSNIERVGHRRWCLNPTMKKTGFGITGRFSAMWSFDESGLAPKGLKTVCYPPAGIVPSTYFGNQHAWSISTLIGPAMNAAKTRITVTALDDVFLPMGAPLPLENVKFHAGGQGASSCVIFRPKGLDASAGHRYWLTVSLDEGKSIWLQHVTEFSTPVF